MGRTNIKTTEDYMGPDQDTIRDQMGKVTLEGLASKEKDEEPVFRGQLHHLLSSAIYWISDYELSFWFVGKTTGMQDKLLKVLRQYKADYAQLLTNVQS